MSANYLEWTLCDLLFAKIIGNTVTPPTPHEAELNRLNLSYPSPWGHTPTYQKKGTWFTQSKQFEESVLQNDLLQEMGFQVLHGSTINIGTSLLNAT